MDGDTSKRTRATSSRGSFLYGKKGERKVPQLLGNGRGKIYHKGRTEAGKVNTGKVEKNFHFWKKHLDWKEQRARKGKRLEKEFRREERSPAL